MRLQNRKTGEKATFVYLQNDYISPLVLTVDIDGEIKMLKYNSLAELNNDWEDYKEPKDAWWLDNEGFVNHARSIDEDCFEKNKEIGNYFNTKEEAEKAVEKLKAWKRLKDNGFKFDGLKEDYEVVARMYPRRLGNRYIHFNKIEDDKWLKENWEDLHLLFGGEE